MMHRLSRSKFAIASALLAAAFGAITLASAQSGGAAPPSGQTAEVRYTGGNVWRGSIGDRVEVTYREGGKDVTVVGLLAKIEKFAMTLDVDVNGKPGKRVIILGDVKSMNSAASAATVASASSAAANGDSASPAETTAESEPAKGAEIPVRTEYPDTAGPISAPRTDGKKTIFVLPLPGSVGTGLRHDEMEKLEKEMDKLGPGQVMVMRINSPGGRVDEGDKIMVSLSRIKKKHRLVAWIEEAISGAAFTALHADEIYFMDVGTLGAITAYNGAGSLKGQQLDSWLERVYEVGEIGGRDGHIIRCMVYSPLECSYDLDPETGKVTWYQDMTGKYPVSNNKDNLVFNATDAVRSRFAQGKANTEDELFRAMQLDMNRYVVSDVGKRIAAEWKRTQELGHKEIPELIVDLNVKGRGTADAETRMGIQINILGKLIAWWDRAACVMEELAGELPIQSKEDYEAIRAQIKKDLSDLMKEKARERKRG